MTHCGSKRSRRLKLKRNAEDATGLLRPVKGLILVARFSISIHIQSDTFLKKH